MTPLYLFKTARRSVYLKENLQLLAADRGTVVEVSYNRMWVAPEFFDTPVAVGRPAYFVLTDRPYGCFVPVRGGEVVDCQSDEVGMRLRVALRSWVGVPENDLAAFTAAVRASGAAVPGEKFLAPKRDDVGLRAFYDADEDAGWRQAVENVLAMSAQSEVDPYQRSVFFRKSALRVGDEWLSARRVPLAQGDTAVLRLRFFNPHLVEDDLYGKRLRVQTPGDALRVRHPDAFPLDGEVDLALESLGGDPELTVQIGPHVGRHCWISERYSAARTASAAPVPAPATLAPPPQPHRDELLRLYGAVRRNTHFEPAAELDVLDAFDRLLPDEPRLLERRALLHADLDQPAEALQLLQRLDADVLGDEARLLLFRLRVLRGEAGAASLVTTLGLASESRFPALLVALEALDPRVLGRLLPDLVEQVDPEQLPPMITALGERVTDPDALASTAFNLAAVVDERWAFDFLNQRRRALHLSAPQVVDVLIELAGAGEVADAGSELADLAASRVANLIAQGQAEAALSTLRRAGSALPLSQRAALSGRAADRLVERDRPGDAVTALLELGWAACNAGDLDVASRAAHRARCLLPAAPADGSLTADVDTLEQRLEVLWAACEPLLAWRQSETERRRERLRGHFLNRSILVAGGVRQSEWKEHLAEMTGAHVEWAEHYRGAGDDLAAVAQRIEQGRYAAVVHLWQKSGHEVQYRLKDVCKAAGVPFLPATSAGARGLVEAVWGTVDSGE